MIERASKPLHRNILRNTYKSTVLDMSWKLLCVFLALELVGSSSADTMELYNTKQATSDLQWDKHSKSPEEGWEEVSSFDRNRETTIRSYQVCHTDNPDTNNWIRSPYIPKRGGNRIHLDVEFAINRCSADDLESKNSKCKETFNIFYYEADGNVASSTFPPWKEKPYVKIDTVAANAARDVNKKTFSFGPLDREGFYIAIQDLGACMSLLAVRVYYFYCHEVTEHLAVFPKTISGVESASLVTVLGTCVDNSLLSSEEVPQYHCNSNGQWQIPTGECQCKAGYQANMLAFHCKPCPAGTYKLRDGPQNCTRCPSNSGLPATPSSSTFEVERSLPSNNQCPCHPGFARSKDEDISVACTKPPSKPLLTKVVKVNTTSAQLRWAIPKQTGGRTDLYYRLKCQAARVGTNTWKACPAKLAYLAPPRGGKFYETTVRLLRLIPYRKYRVTVYALNGASSEQFPASSGAAINFQTDEGVPSAVKDVKVSYRKDLPVTLEWPTPEEPNGKILGYEVELQPKKPRSSPKPSAHVVAPSVIETISNFIELTDFDKDDEYLVRVRAKTSIGYGPYSSQTSFYTSSVDDGARTGTAGSPPIWIIAVGICGVLVIFILVIVCRYKSTGKIFCLNTSGAEKKKKPSSMQNGLMEHALQERLIVDLPPAGQRIYVDYPDPQAAIARIGRELNPKDIQIEEIIGTGEFAEVCKGKMYSESQYIDVAVKRLKRGSTQKDESNFLREATTMAQFNDPNVVQLIGVVTKNHLAMIVSEYMEHRSLDGYLNLNKDQFSIIQLLEMLRGVASGMRYLSGMKYVHRDLAARNILVNSDNVCKVSDFGLSRTLENDPHATYTTQGGKIAIRWTALECILYRKFTSASDVWSYGIVMWEVMSYGEKPYWDMNNDDVINNVQSGMRLPSPVNCPKPLHDIMVECWSADANARPTFGYLVQILDELLRGPEQLVSERATAAANAIYDAKDIATPNLGRAMDNGEVDSVEKWLELQRLSKYREQFNERGIDNLEKVSNLTINDLKALGIDVTLHINKLENGIRTLKRHLSTSSPTPLSSTRSSNGSTLEDHDDNMHMSVDPNGSFLV